VIKGPDVCIDCALSGCSTRAEALDVSGNMREKVLQGKSVKCEYCGKKESVYGDSDLKKPELPKGVKVNLVLAQGQCKLVKVPA